MIETLLIIALVSAAVLPIVLMIGRAKLSRQSTVMGLWIVGVVFPLAIIFASISHRTPDTVPQVTYRPIEAESDGYVGSDSCRSCHPHEHSTWHASYHRTMTQVATTKTLIAPIRGNKLVAQDYTFRLHKEGEGVYTSIDLPADPDNPYVKRTVNRPIVLTTGSHHMQVLWYGVADNSRVTSMFPFMYLKEAKRWVPRSAAFLQPGHSFTDETGRWNETCIMCHTTHGKSEMRDPLTGKKSNNPRIVDSKVAEFGISCEACHGPGEQHVRVNQNPLTRYDKHLSDSSESTIVNPSRLSHELSSQVCGQCHTVFSAELGDDIIESGRGFLPGQKLDDMEQLFVVRPRDGVDDRLRAILDKDPTFLQEQFWSDGMVRVSGREFNGLVESGCYQRGTMSCLSCHRMHMDKNDKRETKQWANDQLHPLMESNAACVQCHEEFADSKTVENHTHHTFESSGSSCYNCHMPYTSYGLLKAIRSHEISIPSVQSSIETGRPNACNQCHLDQTMGWASNHLSDWYGIETPELNQEQQTVAASILWLLKGDAGQRALIAWSYGWDEALMASGLNWIPPYLGQLLEDPYLVVRYIAQRSLRKIPGFERIGYDFLDSDKVAEANQAVLKLWDELQSQGRQSPVNLSELLLNDDGTLVRDHFDALLKERDDRAVTLAE